LCASNFAAINDRGILSGWHEVMRVLPVQRCSHTARSTPANAGVLHAFFPFAFIVHFKHKVRQSLLQWRDAGALLSLESHQKKHVYRVCPAAVSGRGLFIHAIQRGKKS